MWFRPMGEVFNGFPNDILCFQNGHKQIKSFRLKEEKGYKW